MLEPNICRTCNGIKVRGLRLAYRHESLWQPCWCDGVITCWECRRRKNEEGNDRVKRQLMAERLVGAWDDNDVKKALEYLPDFFHAFLHGQVVVCLHCLAKLTERQRRELSARLLDVITVRALCHISSEADPKYPAGYIGWAYFSTGYNTPAVLIEVRRLLALLG